MTALDATIAQIKGTAMDGTVDPTRAQFLKEKADDLSKVSGNEEEQAQRVDMIAEDECYCQDGEDFFSLTLVASLL